MTNNKQKAQLNTEEGMRALLRIAESAGDTLLDINSDKEEAALLKGIVLGNILLTVTDGTIEELLTGGATTLGFMREINSRNARGASVPDGTYSDINAYLLDKARRGFKKLNDNVNNAVNDVATRRKAAMFTIELLNSLEATYHSNNKR